MKHNGIYKALLKTLNNSIQVGIAAVPQYVVSDISDCRVYQ